MTSPIVTYLGARCIREYLGYVSGTFTDTVAGADATQTTAAQKPTALTLASGQSYPDFDGASGSNFDYLDTPAFVGLPTWNTAHHQIMGYLLRCDSLPGAGNSGWIWNNSSWFNYVDGGAGGVLEIQSLVSDASVVDGVWRAVIIARNGSTGLTTMYLGGVAQASPQVMTWGDDWATSSGERIGDRDTFGDNKLDGGIASMFWGYDTTTSFDGDIATLNAYLTAYLVAPTIQSTASGSAVTILADADFDEETAP